MNYHKDKPPGQIVNPIPVGEPGQGGHGFTEKTLADYIANQRRKAAFDEVAEEDKSKDLEGVYASFYDMFTREQQRWLRARRDGTVCVQFYGYELVLTSKGTWYINDTSGG